MKTAEELTKGWAAKQLNVLERAKDVVNDSWQDGERQGYYAGVQAMLRKSILFDYKDEKRLSIGYVNACLIANAKQLIDKSREEPQAKARRRRA